MKHHMSEFDVFLITYDEPNAEENWAKLQAIAPWAQRVHGVKGFDAAHKRCAELSTTDRFITVDGDNTVYPEFFDLSFEIPDNLNDCSLSWAGKNVVNGLIYGNGGLKLWTKDFVLGMRTHEHANTPEEKVDFCWHEKYVQLNGLYSDTHPNGSAFQAFRAGFREGVKMTLDRGQKLKPGDIKHIIHQKNLNRLLIWASVGADAENGNWAIYGARLGILKSIDPEWDMAQVSDYDWFKTYWTDTILPNFVKAVGTVTNHIEPTPFGKINPLIEKVLPTAIETVGAEIRKATGMSIAYLNAEQSEFFKAVYEPPVRTLSPLATEIDVQNGKL